MEITNLHFLYESVKFNISHPDSSISLSMLIHDIHDFGFALLLVEFRCGLLVTFDPFSDSPYDNFSHLPFSSKS